MGETQGRQQDRGTTRDTDTQDKGQLGELLPQPTLPENTKIHTHQGTGAGLGTWQGCPQARPGPPSSCGASWARLGHKEREKELTVPWMRAGVKDGAEAMEA